LGPRGDHAGHGADEARLFGDRLLVELVRSVPLDRLLLLHIAGIDAAARGLGDRRRNRRVEQQAFRGDIAGVVGGVRIRRKAAEQACAGHQRAIGRTGMDASQCLARKTAEQRVVGIGTDVLAKVEGAAQAADRQHRVERGPERRCGRRGQRRWRVDRRDEGAQRTFLLAARGGGRLRGRQQAR
jgi:hypothetical protein